MFGFLEPICDFFRRLMQKDAPMPDAAPAAAALSPLMQRVQDVQGVMTVEAFHKKQRFRNCFHEAGHIFVAHAYGQPVQGIFIDTPNNRPYALFTNNLAAQLDQMIHQGLAGTPQIVETLLRVIAIAVAGEVQNVEADHEKTTISSRLDADAWNSAANSNEDRDRVIAMMRNAGYHGRTDLVEQAEQRARDRIAEGRAHYEALVTQLNDHTNVVQPALANFLP